MSLSRVSACSGTAARCAAPTISTIKFTLKMPAAMFAETLDNFQHSMRLHRKKHISKMFMATISASHLPDFILRCTNYEMGYFSL
jgi:hypothetical protein